ncbi:MAG: alpha/beta hydrolase [Beijerinckiaceae bacterium]|nr:alpha/beta hydrolase [Beijerinckiaceae bacterium]
MHVKTSAGRIAVRTSTGSRNPLLLIHGNSMNSCVFDALLDGPLGRSYKLIAVDLPGHGASENAAFPEKGYTLPGYADAMLDVLFALDAPNATICGWSLGGHVALEMMANSKSVAGAFVVGAPPVSPGPAAISGFNVTPNTALYMTENLDEASQRLLAEVSVSDPALYNIYEAVARTDERARRIVVESLLAGVGADPAQLLNDEKRPIALIVGENDPSVSMSFLQSIRGPAVWRGSVQTIASAAHAPFLDAPVSFNTLLLQFLRDVAQLRRATPAPPSDQEHRKRLRA